MTRNAHQIQGLINMPFAGDGSLTPMEALEQLRRVAHDPSVNGRVIDRDPALGHHRFEIA
jgi:hypothetical protein